MNGSGFWIATFGTACGVSLSMVLGCTWLRLTLDPSHPMHFFSQVGILGGALGTIINGVAAWIIYRKTKPFEQPARTSLITWFLILATAGLGFGSCALGEETEGATVAPILFCSVPIFIVLGAVLLSRSIDGKR